MSEWSQNQFGSVEEQLRRAADEALTQAHGLALAAHAVADMTAGDTYGNTIFVKANEILLDLGRRIPGVTSRKPLGQRSRFDLLVVEETNTAIYIWRYSDDRSKGRPDAQFKRPVSGLQSAMASLSRGRDDQMTIEDATMTDEELAERDALEAALNRRGSVVFLAYGANFQAGLFSMGFAQITQLDGDGHIRWDHWEELPSRAALDGEEPQIPKPTLRSVEQIEESPRFDVAAADDSDDELDLRARRRDEADNADAESDTASNDDAAGGSESDE